MFFAISVWIIGWAIIATIQRMKEWGWIPTSTTSPQYVQPRLYIPANWIETDEPELGPDDLVLVVQPDVEESSEWSPTLDHLRNGLREELKQIDSHETRLATLSRRVIDLESMLSNNMLALNQTATGQEILRQQYQQEFDRRQQNIHALSGTKLGPPG